jgi:hypothetical protein
VAVEEGGQIQRRNKAAERVAGVRQRHVERVDVLDAGVGQEVSLIAPVDLGLSTGHDLEAAVQPGQRVVIGPLQLGGDPRPRLGQETFTR